MTRQRIHGGHYSDGQDRTPDDARKQHIGRFSEGLDHAPDEVREEHAARFTSARRIGLPEPRRGGPPSRGSPFRAA